MRLNVITWSSWKIRELSRIKILERCQIPLDEEFLLQASWWFSFFDIENIHSGKWCVKTRFDNTKIIPITSPCDMANENDCEKIHSNDQMGI